MTDIIPLYICQDCGCPINEGESKCFGVCDTCWDTHVSKRNAGETWLKHHANNLEQNLGLSTMEVIVNAMIEFKKHEVNGKRIS